MLKRIRRKWRQWRDAEHPFKKLWRWWKRGKTPERQLKRLRGLQRWAKAHKEAATTDARRAYWRVRFRAYRKRARAKREWIKEHDTDAPSPDGNTGCGPPGSPYWSGGMTICEREVVPVAASWGVPVSSRKRTSTLGNPSSDHYVGNTTAYAVDLATYSGQGLAYAIARKLGINNFTPGNYNSYYIKRCERTFRVQILWAVSGHYNHVHVGVRRA